MLGAAGGVGARRHPPQLAGPGRKVARFCQIENKIDVLLRYGLATQIPVIDER